MLVSPLRGDEKEYAIIAQTISFNSKNLNLPVEDSLVKHPLLAVYAIKVSIGILGDNKIGYRFFGFLAGCLTLIILYRFLLQTKSERVALIGVLLLGLNVFHISASIANSLTIFFSLCVLILFWKGMIEDKGWPIFVSGIIMGLGYLNKEMIAGLLVCFFIYGWLFEERKRFFMKTGRLLLAFSLPLLPYFIYINKFGSISRLLDKDYMLNFGFHFSGIDFYLVRLRGFLQGLDYRSLLSWEHYPMGILSGVLFVIGTVTGAIREKGQMAKFMVVIFIFFVTASCFLARAEHTWAQITIIPAVYFTSGLLADWYQRSTFLFYCGRGLIIALTAFPLVFLYQSRILEPPNRFSAVVDYDMDLMEWYYQHGRLDEAVHEGELALSICPNELRVLKLMGTIYASKGDQEKARVYFQKALPKK